MTEQRSCCVLNGARCYMLISDSRNGTFRKEVKMVCRSTSWLYMTTAKSHRDLRLCTRCISSNMHVLGYHSLLGTVSWARPRARSSTLGFAFANPSQFLDITLDLTSKLSPPEQNRVQSVFCCLLRQGETGILSAYSLPDCVRHQMQPSSNSRVFFFRSME